jgi:hypothetical protein
MPKKSPAALTFTEAVKAGHREALEAMRDKLAADMELAEPAVVAQIAGRLQAVLKELADLEVPTEVSPSDELAARLARRRAEAATRSPATG